MQTMSFELPLALDNVTQHYKLYMYTAIDVLWCIMFVAKTHQRMHQMTH